MIDRAKITAKVEDAWLDELGERLKMFYRNEVTEDSGTADGQLRASLREMKQAIDESVKIVNEVFGGSS
jgi:hypothetical protein